MDPSSESGEEILRVRVGGQGFQILFSRIMDFFFLIGIFLTNQVNTKFLLPPLQSKREGGGKVTYIHLALELNMIER